jgi:phage tail protein X
LNEPARDGETVDQICWRIFARTDGLTEQVLAMNPGLADLGPRLPAGTPVTLPDLAQVTPTMRETVSLWD